MIARTRPIRPSGFTLIELLVVMGVIAVLSALTTVAVQAIARDARLSSGRNAIVAALDQARGLAMKNNNVVLLAFRPRFSGKNDMRVDIVLAEWTGESYVLDLFGAGAFGVVDRFVLVEGTAPRPLPKGIKVAGPRYGEGLDAGWETQSHLPAIDQSNPFSAASEVPGRLLGIMFGPDGTVITRNSQSDSNRSFIDFDADGLLDWNLAQYPMLVGNSVNYGEVFWSAVENDEPFVSNSPFLAVYDDTTLREGKVADWTWGGGAAAARDSELDAFVHDNADPLHFNRYTGVVMK